jgi:hypothetical protein
MPQQTASLGLLLPAVAFLLSANVQLVRHLFSANGANPALSHARARNGTAKAHAKEEMANQDEANWFQKSGMPRSRIAKQARNPSIPLLKLPPKFKNPSSPFPAAPQHHRSSAIAERG